AVKINSLISHVERTTNALTRHITKLTEYTIKELLAAAKMNIQLLTQTYRAELTDFLTALTALMESKTSPFLLDPKNLKQAYSQLCQSALLQGMRPLINDPGIVYKSQTDTLIRNNTISVFIHIPLYTGTLMDLFHYIPTPIFLQSPLAIQIMPDHQYLALDSAKALAKEFTQMELDQCTKLGEIFHCSKKNILRRDLKQICLYNLYQQQISSIKKNCPIKVKQIPFMARQLKENIFQLSASNKTQITTTCRDQPPNITIIQGNSILKLTEKCPTATTEAYVFHYNPYIVVNAKLISLPILINTTAWLQPLQLDITDVTQMFNEIKTTHDALDYTSFVRETKRYQSKDYENIGHS
ncbi:Hypothetical predicted protein, partial [Paramuricea clavata]